MINLETEINHECDYLKSRIEGLKLIEVLLKIILGK
jgi:hypothetical protein